MKKSNKGFTMLALMVTIAAFALAGTTFLVFSYSKIIPQSQTFKRDTISDTNIQNGVYWAEVQITKQVEEQFVEDNLTEAGLEALYQPMVDQLVADGMLDDDPNVAGTEIYNYVMDGYGIYPGLKELYNESLQNALVYDQTFIDELMTPQADGNNGFEVTAIDTSDITDNVGDNAYDFNVDKYSVVITVNGFSEDPNASGGRVNKSADVELELDFVPPSFVLSNPNGGGGPGTPPYLEPKETPFTNPLLIGKSNTNGESSLIIHESADLIVQGSLYVPNGLEIEVSKNAAPYESGGLWMGDTGIDKSNYPELETTYLYAYGDMSLMQGNIFYNPGLTQNADNNTVEIVSVFQSDQYDGIADGNNKGMNISYVYPNVYTQAGALSNTNKRLDVTNFYYCNVEAGDTSGVPYVPGTEQALYKEAKTNYYYLAGADVGKKETEMVNKPYSSNPPYFSVDPTNVAETNSEVRNDNFGNGLSRMPKSEIDAMVNVDEVHNSFVAVNGAEMKLLYEELLQDPKTSESANYIPSTQTVITVDDLQNSGPGNPIIYVGNCEELVIDLTGATWTVQSYGFIYNTGKITIKNGPDITWSEEPHLKFNGIIASDTTIEIGSTAQDDYTKVEVNIPENIFVDWQNPNYSGNNPFVYILKGLAPTSGNEYDVFYQDPGFAIPPGTVPDWGETVGGSSEVPLNFSASNEALTIGWSEEVTP